jgi:hypothetical protein
MHRAPGLPLPARRALVTLLFALWWGGFTFYAAVVVPVGTKVLGGATAQGFITQPVTDRLNVVGAVVAVILGWSLRDAWPRAGTGARRAMLGSWCVLTLAQLVLFVLHPRLDAMLDARTGEIVLGRTTFYSVHRAYLLVSAAQWLAAIVHAFAVATAWAQAAESQPRSVS